MKEKRFGTLVPSLVRFTKLHNELLTPIAQVIMIGCDLHDHNLLLRYAEYTADPKQLLGPQNNAVAFAGLVKARVEGVAEKRRPEGSTQGGATFPVSALQALGEDGGDLIPLAHANGNGCFDPPGLV